ncbi:MAG: adaptor protein MecA [Acetatifactor sp.]
MKIEKVNENQIRCTLTREDLASRELKLSELAYGTEKAKNLFRDMMQQANFEFGFEAEDIPLMIEAIPLNAECIVLIITKVEDPEELDTRFSRFSPSESEEDEDDDEEMLTRTPDEVLDLFRRLQKEQHTEETTAPKASASEKQPANVTRIFLFRTLKQVMDASALIAPHYHGLSTLYKDERSAQYLMVLTQGEESSEIFDRACNVLSEYGSLQRNASVSRTFLEEHYEALAEGNAVSALGNI